MVVLVVKSSLCKKGVSCIISRILGNSYLLLQSWVILLFQHSEVDLAYQRWSNYTSHDPFKLIFSLAQTGCTFKDTFDMFAFFIGDIKARGTQTD